MRMARWMSVVLFVLAAVLSWSQAAKEAAPKYDPAREVTVKGVIEEVKEYTCPVSGGKGGHFVLKTDEGKLEVHLATTRFLSEYGITFAKGDEVAVVGMKATVHEKPALLARKIERGNDVFFVRDPKGRPIW